MDGRAPRRPPRAGSSWSVTVRGERGALRHGYQVAARLDRWTLERTGRTYVVHATVADRHAHWSRQRPLDLVLDWPGHGWCWHDVAPPTTDGETAWTFHAPPDRD